MTKPPTRQYNLYGNKVVHEYKDEGAPGGSRGNSVNAGVVRALLVKLPFASYEDHEGIHGTFHSVIIETLRGERIDGSIIPRDTVELVFSSKRLTWLLDKLFSGGGVTYSESNNYIIEGIGTGFERHYKITEVSLE